MFFFLFVLFSLGIRSQTISNAIKFISIHFNVKCKFKHITFTANAKQVNFLVNLIFPNDVVNNEIEFNRKSFHEHLHANIDMPIDERQKLVHNLFDCHFMQISYVNNTIGFETKMIYTQASISSELILGRSLYFFFV